MDKDWNYDRIVTAQAQMAQVNNDMMRILHSGQLNQGVQDRMVAFLRSAADDLDKMKVT